MDNYSKKNFKKNKNNLIKNYKISGNLFIGKKISKNKVVKKIQLLKITSFAFDYSVNNYNDQMFDVSFKNQKKFFLKIFINFQFYIRKRNLL